MKNSFHIFKTLFFLLPFLNSTSVFSQKKENLDFEKFHKLYNSASANIINNPLKSIFYFDKSSRLLESITRDKNNTDIPFNNTSLATDINNNINKLNAYEKTVKNQDNYDSKLILAAFDSIIKIYNWTNNKKLRWERHYEALKYSKKTKDTSYIIKLSLEIADKNSSSLFLSNADTHFKSAKIYLDNFSKKDRLLQVEYYQRFAAYQNTLEEEEKSVTFSKKALELLSQTNNYDRKAISHNELGFSYDRLNECDSALMHIDKAINYWEKSNHKENIPLAYLNKANILKKCYSETESIVFYKQSLQSALSENIYWITTTAQKKISDYYFKTKNYKDAYLYMKIGTYLSYFEKKYKEKKEQLIIETKYQSVENLKKIQTQTTLITDINKEKEILKTSTIIGIAVSCFLLFGLIVILFYSKKLKKRGQQLLKQQKTIHKQNKELNSSLEKNKTLLKEVHHRVKNNLSILSGLFHLQQKEVTEEAHKKFLRECTNRIHSMALVHQKLYSTENISKFVDFGTYCKDLINTLALSNAPNNKNITYNIETNNIELSLDLTIPLAIITTELVTNSYKYAFNDVSDGEIGVVLQQFDEDLELEIYDTGKGIPDKIDVHQLNSLGLKLVSILSKQIFAKQEYQYKENRSSFFFSFKIDF